MRIRSKSKILVLIFFSVLFITTAVLLSSNASENEQKPNSSSTFITIDSPVAALVPLSLHEIKGLMTLLNQPNKEERTENRQVKYGDSFYSIFLKNNIDREKATRLSNAINRVYNRKEFKAGNPYSIHFPPGELAPDYLIYPINDTTDWVVSFTAESVELKIKPVRIQIKKAQAAINGSLARTINHLNCPDDLTDKILSIFAWSFDFGDLKKGDKFSVVFEEKSVDGVTIGSGDIHAIRFIHKGKEYQAYGFDNGNGTEYFDASGNNYSHAPLLFDIISSTYSKWRKHPVRQTYRAHLGMDFMAETGTPIEAIKSGKVLAATFQRANGNYVKLLHDDGIITQYLHMSRIDSTIAVGDYIAQGQKIGEVGNTGLSSGPHLCFRVWKDNKQRDPLNFKFPVRAPVKEENMAAFKARVASFNKADEFVNEEVLSSN